MGPALSQSMDWPAIVVLLGHNRSIGTLMIAHDVA